MSDDTQAASVTDALPSSISSAVDADEIESLLEDDSLDAAGRELGSQIGREVGGRVGRRLGPSIARDIWERKNPWTILKNAVRRLVTIIVETVKNVDLESHIPKLTDAGRRIMSEDSLKEGVSTVVPSGLVDTSDEETESDEAADEGAEAGEEAADEAEADEEATDDEGSTEEDSSERDGVPDVEMPGDIDLSADEIQDLKKETYRELLESMSYRDLQSVAKDVGVKANLAQDEMTDRIVEEFSEEGEA